MALPLKGIVPGVFGEVGGGEAAAGRVEVFQDSGHIDG